MYDVLFISVFSKKYYTTLCFSLKKGRSAMASFLVCHCKFWYRNDYIEYTEISITVCLYNNTDIHDNVLTYPFYLIRRHDKC